jgi:NTE family protein
VPAGIATAFPAWMFNLDRWPLYGLWDAWLKSFSPAQLNPLDLNPLRDILQRHVDVELLRGGPLKVQVTATAVSTGQPRVFNGAALSIDALLASACLPQLYRAVEIDGEAWWDGGYSGNPSIWPLIYNTEAVDVLLVQINPLVRPGVPGTATEIADRMNEITFNASLVAEMRAIAFVQKLVREQRVSADDYKDLRLHRIADEAGLAPFDASSKLNTDIRLLETLFELGRAAATRWLAEHGDAVGQRGTVDIAATWLKPR